MLNNYLYSQITRNFPHQPTDEQHLALQKLADFLLSQESDLLFLLKGYAGTGKTSLIGALVKTMAELKQKSVLLAPRSCRQGLFRLCRTEGLHHPQENLPAESLLERTLRIPAR